MQDFERLIGNWLGGGEIEVPPGPSMKLSERVRIEPLGAFLVMSTVGEPAELPDSIAIIGGAVDGAQPMHYFDSRGVKRMYMTAVEGATWKIWRAPGEDWSDAHGPGFNQRFFGEISADGDTIDARWERGVGEAGDDWELDFRITYARSMPSR
jgi:hypothetical protein